MTVPVRSEASGVRMIGGATNSGSPTLISTRNASGRTLQTSATAAFASTRVRKEQRCRQLVAHPQITVRVFDRRVPPELEVSIGAVAVDAVTRPLRDPHRCEQAGVIHQRRGKANRAADILREQTRFQGRSTLVSAALRRTADATPERQGLAGRDNQSIELRKCERDVVPFAHKSCFLTRVAAHRKRVLDDAVPEASRYASTIGKPRSTHAVLERAGCLTQPPSQRERHESAKQPAE